MISVLNYPHLGLFILAWFVADLLIPVLIKFSHRLDLLDRPGGHKGQKKPIPFVGGVGIFIAFGIAIASTLRFGDVQDFYPFLGLLLAGGVVVVLGLIDDFRPINAVFKLGVLFATTIVLGISGIHLNLFPDVLFNLPNMVITLLWIVGVTSAANSLDNTDGVVGGVSVIASFFVFVIAWGSSATDAQPFLSYMAVALAGSCLGFLRYNFSPARIYLGDNGAFFLGFILAAMLVFAEYSTDPIKAMLVPGLILSVPVFDIILATALRIRDGDVRSIKEAVLYCGQDHLAHLLQRLNLSKTQAALAIYALSIIGGCTALLVLAADTPALYLTITGMYFTFLTAVGLVVGRVRQPDGPKEEIPQGTEAEVLMKVPANSEDPRSTMAKAAEKDEELTKA